MSGMAIIYRSKLSPMPGFGSKNPIPFTPDTCISLTGIHFQTLIIPTARSIIKYMQMLHISVFMMVVHANQTDLMEGYIIGLEDRLSKHCGPGLDCSEAAV